MRRPGSIQVILFGLAVGAGALLAARLAFPARAPPPDPPAVVERIRQVARLEVLQVSLYKKIGFAPEPSPADSIWGDLAGWLRHAMAPPRGKAFVFAEARIGVDVSRLGPDAVALRGRTCFVVLPPTEVVVELRPGDTEVIGSNLDSAQTAQLLELARRAFEREVGADQALQARARHAVEVALSALLLQAGLDRVEFVERLPAGSGGPGS